MSIAKLTAGAKITRQAITKHLRVLEQARLVHGTRQGRERHWQLDGRRLDDARRYLDLISTQWDNALTFGAHNNRGGPTPADPTIALSPPACETSRRAPD
jgi:hypothetical protein